MNILVLCDDKYHPAAVPRSGLALLAKGEFAVTFLENGRDWATWRLANIDVILLTKANHVSATDTDPWMTDAVARELYDFVAGGKGLLAVHSGTVGYNDIPLIHGMLGGGFVKHPPQCTVAIEPARHNRLTTGLAPFAVRDEHYMMTPLADDAEVFVTTHSEHGRQPGGWLRYEGAGRVGVLTPGHNLEVWLHPTFQQLLKNTLHWCDGRGPQRELEVSVNA